MLISQHKDGAVILTKLTKFTYTVRLYDKCRTLKKMIIFDYQKNVRGKKKSFKNPNYLLRSLARCSIFEEIKYKDLLINKTPSPDIFTDELYHI